jgi:hypothetical protein
MGFQPTRFDPPARLGLYKSDEPQSLPALPKVELEIVRGTARHTRRHVVGKVFLIGSACDCDLVLGDEQFPDGYAYLFVQPDGVTVRHLGGGPAVVVNGEPVQARRMKHGEVLECGPYAFRLVISSTEPIRDEKPSPPAHHMSQTHEQIAAFVSADEVLGLRVAREEVSQLLVDIGAALRSHADSLKVYCEPGTLLGGSLAQRVRRRASA